MRITACTERIFLKQLAPLAHLPFGEVCGVNDNKLQLPMHPALCPQHQLRSVLASHAAQRDARKQGRRMPRVVFTPKRLSQDELLQGQPASAATQPVMV